ncbi:hypothetical protein D043_0082B, partial [Vibrio parahaemolyticus EKP-021]
RYTK